MYVISLYLGWIDLEKLRIPGVLQRFSITYFVVASTGIVFLETLEPKCVNEVCTSLVTVSYTHLTLPTTPYV